MPRPLKTTQRGYGAQHQAERAKWRPTVDAGLAACWRCGQPIQPGEPWDLGHDDDDRGVYRGPEHANRCNRTAGARRGGHARHRNRQPKRSNTRRW